MSMQALKHLKFVIVIIPPKLILLSTVQRHCINNISVEILGEFDVSLREKVEFTASNSDDRSSSPIVGQPYNN